MSFNGIKITEDELADAVFNMNYGDGPKPGPCESREIARLMLAAPDLLAACKDFVRKCDNGEARSRRSYAQMKTAIDKAEGVPAKPVGVAGYFRG